VVDAGEVAFATCGSGPALLVPWCNVPWPDLPVVDRLAQQYLVVLASPRGYQYSSRLSSDQDYGMETGAHDLIAVCDALGAAEFAVLGYSLTAVLAGWLACTSSRVTFAVLGGFPLLGSYARVSRAAERDVAQLSTDPGFDTRAALALYRDLAELPDGRLIDDRRCPVHVFWGSADTVLQGFDVTAGLDDALTARGVSTSIVDGADHVTTLLDTDAIIRAVAAGAR
jgi:pimeloyl-ACP methyl ester carboxylesterase